MHVFKIPDPIQNFMIVLQKTSVAPPQKLVWPPCYTSVLLCFANQIVELLYYWKYVYTIT